ncbi:hypothetical protein V8F33_014080 [Rhypophila sp. PSN 637]
MADSDDAVEGKLPLLRNPVVRTIRSREGTFDVLQANAEPNLNGFGYRDEVYLPGEEIPEFERHIEATSIEVFYDLFFAANLCVFAEVQDVTNAQQVATFVCYFCLLWFTWLALGLFDVRFVTDSVFERIVRAVHFGAMVGFAVVAPNFNLAEQDPRTFRTMSLILTTSRAALGFQYGTILWHVRKFKSSRIGLAIMCGLNFIAAFIYLGAAFAFKEKGTEALWVLWFVVTLVEVAVSVWGSYQWEVLSFYGTHLTNRVSLLTFILMGEGIVTVCSAVSKIVLNANQWTTPTIGNVAAGVANIYFIYMIYMDWRRAKRFPRAKQLIWSFLHLPFHLALKLFILASSQFVIFWKIFETAYWVDNEFTVAMGAALDPTSDFNITTEWFVGTIEEVVNKTFAIYVPKYFGTYAAVQNATAELRKMPDTIWNLPDPSLATPEEQELFVVVQSQLNTLLLSVQNSLFSTFNINGYGGISDDIELFETAETEALELNSQKFRTVVIAAYVGAGFTLILLNILFIISRSRKWTTFNYVRKGINFLIGIGLCLVSLITLDDLKAAEYTSTPWPLPTIVFTLFLVLVINHLPHPPPIFFSGRAKPQEGEGAKMGSGSPSFVSPVGKGTHETKSGYQNVSVRDQEY